MFRKDGDVPGFCNQAVERQPIPPQQLSYLLGQYPLLPLLNRRFLLNFQPPRLMDFFAGRNFANSPKIMFFTKVWAVFVGQLAKN